MPTGPQSSRGGFVAVPAKHQVSSEDETIAFILDGRAVRWRLSDASGRALLPKGLPVVDFDGRRSRRIHRLPEPGPFVTVAHADNGRDRSPSWAGGGGGGGASPDHGV